MGLLLFWNYGDIGNFDCLISQSATLAYTCFDNNMVWMHYNPANDFISLDKNASWCCDSLSLPTTWLGFVLLSTLHGISLILKQPLNSGHPATPYNGQFSRSQL